MQKILVNRSSTLLIFNFIAFASFCFLVLAVFELVTGAVFSSTLGGLKFSMLCLLALWNGKMALEIYRVHKQPNESRES